MRPIAEALSTVTLGAPIQAGNLSMIPLLTRGDEAADYVLLDDALERKVARVTEVSESGSVPELRFTNEGSEPVLLVDGEELVGARQNRILNLTIMVGGAREIAVPVSCVERGRWYWKSRNFSGAKRTLFTKARAKKMMRVSASMRATGSRRSDQGEIWDDIQEKAAFFHASSDTDAMGDIYEQQEAKLAAYVNMLLPVQGQTGAVFAVNGRVIGLELFDSSATFRKFLEKVVRGYALDAIEEPNAGATPPVAEAVRKFLSDTQTAALSRFPAVGEGEDLRLESAGIAGGALYARNRIVHLCAFQVARPEGGETREVRP